MFKVPFGAGSSLREKQAGCGRSSRAGKGERRGALWPSEAVGGRERPLLPGKRRQEERTQPEGAPVEGQLCSA